MTEDCPLSIPDEQVDFAVEASPKFRAILDLKQLRFAGAPGGRYHSECHFTGLLNARSWNVGADEDEDHARWFVRSFMGMVASLLPPTLRSTRRSPTSFRSSSVTANDTTLGNVTANGFDRAVVDGNDPVARVRGLGR